MFFAVCLGSISLVSILHAGGQAVELQREGTHINILIGGQLFSVYYFDPKIAKPYLQPLRSARGTIVTREFPVGDYIPPAHEHDRSLEPHQRPLYFAHGDIDGVDFWGEEVFAHWSGPAHPFGRTVFRKLDELRGGPDSGALKAEFDLVGPDNKPIASETQGYVFGGDDQVRMIDCEIIVQADHGPVNMRDTKEGTFAIRVAPALNSPPAAMVDSEGRVGEAQIWGKRADWVDYYGTVDGESVGIAVLDHPENFRHPTTWHARGYGLFAANAFGIREFTHDPHQDGSYTIPPGHTLAFRYRVIIHHGDYKQADIAGAYRQYAGGLTPPGPRPKE
jgi:hypothetical protein